MQFDDLKRIKKIDDYFSNTFDCNNVFIDCNVPWSKKNKSIGMGLL